MIQERLVDWLIRTAKRTPYLHIYDWGLDVVARPGDPALYMERYWLWGLSYDSWFGRVTGCAVRLHCIRRADQERHLHDHPWSFLSLVLRGGYVEVRPEAPTKWVPWGFQGDGVEREDTMGSLRVPFSWALRRATDRHQIIQISDKEETWTIFITGPKRQFWGFYLPDEHGRLRKFHHSSYTGGRKSGISFV